MSGTLLVAHLVRRQEGVAAFARFLTSYQRHPADCAHELVLLVKGFTGGAGWEPYQQLLEGVAHRRYVVPEEGFDLGAYRSFLPAASGSTVLFLNSHSEILVDGWLGLMVRHAGPRRLVGATASWESHHPNRMDERPAPRVGTLRRLRRAMAAFRMSWRADHPLYLPFPNPSIRTNAFLVHPDLHHIIGAWPVPRSKEDCFALESGCHGLSQTTIIGGGTLCLATADGRGIPPLGWPEAGVFRSEGQHNLIVSDNQTRYYAAANLAEKRALGWGAWRNFHQLGST